MFKITNSLYQSPTNVLKLSQDIDNILYWLLLSIITLYLKGVI